MSWKKNQDVWNVKGTSDLEQATKNQGVSATRICRDFPPECVRTLENRPGLKRNFYLPTIHFQGHATLPETNGSPLKMGFSNRKVVFQPSMFRCYVSFRDMLVCFFLVGGGGSKKFCWQHLFKLPNNTKKDSR